MQDDVQQPTTTAPEPGRVVNDDVLITTWIGGYAGMRPFTGNMRPAEVWQQMMAGTRLAFDLYRELEEKDDTVGDAVEEMKRSVLKRNMTVVPVDETDSNAADIAKFIQAQFDGLPNWRNTLEAMLDAPFYGYSVAEQIFDVSSGQVALLDVRDCPQELFSFNPPMRPQTGQLRLHQTLGDFYGTPMPENKFVVWTSRMRAGNRKGRPLLREIYWPSWINRNVLKFWLRLVERGPGTAVTSYADGATPDEKNQALRAAEALVESIAIAVPSTMVIRDEFLKVARLQDPSAFEKLSDRMESKIIRRIVGSTLTSKGSEGGKGTQSLGKVHENTKDERSVEYALQLETLINRNIIQQLVLWNFGPDAPGVRFVIDKSDEEDLGARITVDDTLQSMGLAIPESYARKRYGVPAPATNEATLQRTAAPTTITTPAGAPDAPQFADDPALGLQVHREQSDFDKLFSQMRKKGVDIYGQQIEDLAQQALERR